MANIENFDIDANQSSRHEQGQGLVMRAKEWLSAIRRANPNIAGVDKDVSDLVEEAHSGELPAETTETVLVTGIEEVVTDGLMAKETISALDATQTNALGEALNAVGSVDGDEAVARVIEAIEHTLPAQAEAVAVKDALSIDTSSLEELTVAYSQEEQSVRDAIKDVLSRPLDIRDGHQMASYAKIVKVMESVHGDALRWREELGSPDNALPDEVRHLVNNEHYLPNVYFHNATADYGSRIQILQERYQQDGSTNMDELLQLKDVYSRKTAASISYALNIKANGGEARLDMARAYYFGDLQTFGVSGFYDGTVYMPATKYAESAKDYLANVSALSPAGCDAVNKAFGTVNFDRYNIRQLLLMSQVAEGDSFAIERLKEECPSIVVTGANGDHNGAYKQLIKPLETSSTLFFEVRDMDSLRQISPYLKSIGLDEIARLTIGGHGGESGIHLTRDMVIGGSGKPQAEQAVTVSAIYETALKELYRMIRPDAHTGRPSVNIASCSQAKKFKTDKAGKSLSTAELIAMAHPGMNVTASSQIAYFAGESHQARADKGERLMLNPNASVRLLERLRTKKNTPSIVIKFLERRTQIMANKGKYYIASSTIVRAERDGTGHRLYRKRSDGRVKIGT